MDYKHHEAACVGWGLVGTRAVWLSCQAPSKGVLGAVGFRLWQGRKAGKALGWG